MKIVVCNVMKCRTIFVWLLACYLCIIFSFAYLLELNIRNFVSSSFATCSMFWQIHLFIFGHLWRACVCSRPSKLILVMRDDSITIRFQCVWLHRIVRLTSWSNESFSFNRFLACGYFNSIVNFGFIWLYSFNISVPHVSEWMIESTLE